ncbi:MAG: rane protein [Segetibacter sp.]|nr:rane protein [Segetibacter sp.]
MEQIIALVTLILLEVVLGLDNIIFISIVAARLPAHQQKKARRMGIMLAMVLRLALLTIISFILKLQGELFNLFGNSISSKDIILILGGLFLLYKASSEIYHKIEGEEGDTSTSIRASSFNSIIIQILILDLVFSVDSIITAVGMVNELWIMYAAVIITVAIMLFASEPISRFINKHPAFKMLALSFLLLIGVSLIGEGLDFNIPKGYIYFAIAFSLGVDILQMKMNKAKRSNVQLHEHYLQGEEKLEKDIL